ncbi:histidine phosphatase family protein [Chloroflexota bacterium]
MSRLLLVRHGNTKLNNATRFWGKTDVELSDEGVRQAEQLRDRLATQKINAIYASNLSRARLTAEMIASRHRLNVKTCTEMGEINFGFIEGLTFEEIKKLHPELAEELSNWSVSPQFPGGESLDDLNSRVQTFLKRLEKHKPEETILIVAHSATLRLLICNLLEIDLHHWRQMRLDLASLSILETYSQGTILNLLNDVSHLKP